MHALSEEELLFVIIVKSFISIFDFNKITGRVQLFQDLSGGKLAGEVVGL